MARKGAKRRRSAEDLRGERLSYGEPVTVGGRTVITVTRVRASGAGKGRAVDATPVGYIEMTADGSAYHPIEDPAPRGCGPPRPRRRRSSGCSPAHAPFAHRAARSGCCRPAAASVKR